MPDVAVQGDPGPRVERPEAERWMPAVPAWRVVLSRELAELWIGGKGLFLILAFSVLLGIETFVLATNFELSLFSPEEMVFEITKAAVQVSLLIGLIIGADSISGERERGTMEGLLLTPASRHQIVLGKFLAALTAWPVALVITIPFMVRLGDGIGVIPRAFLGGALVGLVLIPAFVAIGMIVSFFCSSNKNSYFISLGIFLIVILQGRQWANPVPAAFDFLSGVLVDDLPFGELWRSLVSPVVFTLLALALLFFYVSRNLTVEAGTSTGVWSKITRRSGLALLATFFLVVSVTIPVSATAAPQTSGLEMSISLDHMIGQTGDSIEFETELVNIGSESSPPVIVAMNIISLSKTGEVVDPEDWAPERTQYVDELAAGESVTLSWTVDAVLDGDYMVYLVGILEPEGPESSSDIVTSPGLHLTIEAFSDLNPSGVLPYAIGVPIFVVGVILLVFWLRRRRIQPVASDDAPA